FLEDFSDSCAFGADDRIVAREAGGHFADDAEADGVVIAAGDERRPSGRAKSGGAELRVAQARFGDAVHGWCRDDTAEGARDAVALIVGHDEQHIRRTFARHDTRRPVRLGVFGTFLYYAAKLSRRRRQLLAVDRL